MVEKNSQLLTTLFLSMLVVGMLPICNGQQKTLGSVAAYQCNSEYAEIKTPPAISPTQRTLRVCIASASSATECKKVAEATMSQVSKSIEERLIVNGQHHSAFAGIIEIATKGNMCMLATKLTKKYFIKTTSATSLQVLISGSVSTLASGNTTAHLHPFKVAVKLALSAAPKPTTTPKPALVKPYQCTPDGIAVAKSHTISSEDRMLRVCIEGVHSAAKCQKVMAATITQASKNIADRLVESGTELAAWKDNIEITAKAGKCMVAAHLAEKYFIKTSSAKSLQVVMSGSVTVAGNLRADCGQAETAAPFEVAVDLSAPNPNPNPGEDIDDPSPMPPVPAHAVASAATGCYNMGGVAAAILVLMALM